MKRLIVAVLLLLPIVLHAQICTVPEPGIIIVKFGRFKEFQSLYIAGLYDSRFDDELEKCCVACLVETGAKVIVTDEYCGEYYKSRCRLELYKVRVLDGKHKGCVGETPSIRDMECKH